MSDLDMAKRLYVAFRERDAWTLWHLLHPDFKGHVSEGMPMNVGGEVPNRQRMLGVWGTIASRFHVTPEPESFAEANDGRVFVVGRYKGTSEKGAAVDAAFVHVLRFRDGAIASLNQITDTVRWG